MSEPIIRPGCIHCENGDFPLNKPKPYGKSTSIGGEAQVPGDGASANRNTINFFGMSAKELIVIVILICALVFTVSRLAYYEDKYQAAARELADENRLRRNHDDQLNIELQAAQAVLALTRCKP